MIQNNFILPVFLIILMALSTLNTSAHFYPSIRELHFLFTCTGLITVAIMLGWVNLRSAGVTPCSVSAHLVHDNEKRY